MSSNISEEIQKSMRKTGQVWRAAFNQALGAVDLTLLQWAVLELVTETPGLSQIEMARTLGIEGPSLVRLLDPLEEGGWLYRETDDVDRRMKRVYPNEAARARWVQTEKILKSVHDHALKGMSVRDQKELLRLHELMASNLAKLT